MKYILYCRKSTDTEDRQVLSLDSQERELLTIAEKLNLKIVKVFKESRTAKEAGRPIFNEVIAMINAGKADAILCWKLDRLARNFLANFSRLPRFTLTLRSRLYWLAIPNCIARMNEVSLGK